MYRVVDAVDAGFPGARTIIRTYREVWQTRKTGKRDKCGRGVRKAFGKPTKEVAYHVPALGVHDRHEPHDLVHELPVRREVPRQLPKRLSR